MMTFESKVRKVIAHFFIETGEHDKQGNSDTLEEIYVVSNWETGEISVVIKGWMQNHRGSFKDMTRFLTVKELETIWGINLDSLLKKSNVSNVWYT